MPKRKGDRDAFNRMMTTPSRVDNWMRQMQKERRSDAIYYSACETSATRWQLLIQFISGPFKSHLTHRCWPAKQQNNAALANLHANFCVLSRRKPHSCRMHALRATQIGRLSALKCTPQRHKDSACYAIVSATQGCVHRRRACNQCNHTRFKFLSAARLRIFNLEKAR